MSSNNQLVIIKQRKEFLIFHHHCVDNDFIASKETLLKKEKTLVKAIEYANKICLEDMIEYGYYISKSCLEENDKEIEKKIKKEDKEKGKK